MNFLLLVAASALFFLTMPTLQMHGGGVEAVSFGNFMYNCQSDGFCSNFTAYHSVCTTFGVKPYETYVSQLFCAVGGGFQVVVYQSSSSCSGTPQLVLVGFDNQQTTDRSGSIDGYFTVSCISSP
eukprot:CAMPEP_0176433980 /NCGR_PEP_ID=MMETSP0127-20121128/16385_1 /TAXON_ID=938130 /ORGANISM="Platyophrya macrostoma, Strain WH" /LENGTH=124 /DNA_ID=CAMNT_0017816591 /DNA_START=52 /DNA_END=426 /DNA_ORIENTATION=+